MKRFVIVTLIFLVGIGVLAYPTVSHHLAEKNSSKAIQEHTEIIDGLDEVELARQWAAAEEYNESLTGQPVHDPFLKGTGMAMPDDYRQVLNVSGMMAYLEIPKISLSLPIFHGTADSVLQRGTGHLEGSTLPIGGRSRHTVITGHTGLSHAKLFTDLAELEQGDLFYIHVLGETLAYQVDEIKVIEPEITEDLQRFEGKDYATLLTCTPYGVNSHRLLVRGERVEYVAAARDAIAPLTGTSIDRLVLRAALLTAAAMMVLIVGVVIVKRRRKDRKKP